MFEDTAVIIPTYNSSKTIIKLLSLILKSAPGAPIYVVDDNSPDKTSELIKIKFGKNKKINVLTRRGKDGRGSAVLYGFKQALKNKKNKFFVEMDSDLVHDPKFIRSLIAENKYCDAVIASRYLKQSRNINWKLKRQIFSKAVSFYLKLLLNIPITDYTNGFRSYNRRALEGINFRKIKSKGFFVLTELSYLLYKKKFKFAEIPFTFRLFELNKSNMSFRELKESFLSALRIKLS